MRLILGILIASAPLTAAADPLAAHRADMERLRAQTEMQGLVAATHRFQSTITSAGIRAAVEPRVVVAPPPQFLPTDEEERHQVLARRRAAQEAARDLARRVGSPTPR